MDHLYTLKDILAYINRERSLLGLSELDEIPRGERYSACRCVMSVALCPDDRHANAQTLRTYTYLFQEDQRIAGVMHPPYVQAFIKHFDMGLHPELDIMLGLGSE